jgi:hypothetical protein
MFSAQQMLRSAQHDPHLGVILSEAKDPCIFPAPKYMDSSPPLRCGSE